MSGSRGTSLELTPTEATALATAPTESPEAYALYLRGKEYWERPGVAAGDIEAAIDLFQRAVDLDPQGQLDSLRAIAARLPPDQTGARPNLARLERDWDGLLRIHDERGQSAWIDRSRAYRGLGDDARARAVFDSMFADLESVPESERQAGWYTSRGVAYAFSGRAEEAGADARRVAGWWPDDAYSRMGAEMNALFIFSTAGLVDEACDLIEKMLAEPSPLTVHRLLLDPDFDAIRESPRFQEILARYPPGVAR